MLRKLMITGCRKSGNTLMRVLCNYGFEGMIELPKEPQVKDVERMIILEKGLLGMGFLKFTPKKWILFKSPMPDPTRDIALRTGDIPQRNKHYIDIKQIISEILSCPKLDIICMTRDPRAVLVPRLSLNQAYLYWLPPLRWLQGTRIIDDLLEDHDRIIRIRYEDLINYPDGVQKRIANNFNLKIKKPFSQFQKPEKELCDSDETDLCGIRPIKKDRLKIWETKENQEYLKKIFKEYPEIAKEVKKRI